jgi:hypothetical protein
MAIIMDDEQFFSLLGHRTGLGSTSLWGGFAMRS